MGKESESKLFDKIEEYSRDALADEIAKHAELTDKDPLEAILDGIAHVARTSVSKNLRTVPKPTAGDFRRHIRDRLKNIDNNKNSTASEK